MSCLNGSDTPLLPCNQRWAPAVKQPGAAAESNTAGMRVSVTSTGLGPSHGSCPVPAFVAGSRWEIFVKFDNFGEIENLPLSQTSPGVVPKLVFSATLETC